MALKKIKDGISKFFGKEEEQDYVEIDLGNEVKKNKIIVKPFVLKKFDDVTEILNALREGYTIAVIDIKPIKQKDIIELKRSIAKIKKTAEALEGDIAGFGDSTIIVTPSFAEIYKVNKLTQEKKEAELF
ncbi:cell division protein SepF [Candidatus Pacearchaeota archaeon]|nr:cell division protein SepF [Candidatus Pacearchaeota archaeon]